MDSASDGVEESKALEGDWSVASGLVTAASEVNDDGRAGVESDDDDGAVELNEENESGEDSMADTAAAISPPTLASGTSDAGATDAEPDSKAPMSKILLATRCGPGRVRPMTTIAVTAMATGR
ncbi:MAG: hypothetical protein M3Q68_10645 [Actinomycetota bacterium]|nr:hypothetical protein [Actinomycetota bacterium]